MKARILVISAYAILALDVASHFSGVSLADVFTGFEITDRGTLGYGVPVVRSGSGYGNNKHTALDIVPRGAPEDGAYGKAWTHVCTSDVLGVPQGTPNNCIRVGAFSDHMEIASDSFNGAPVLPIKIKVNNNLVGTIDAGGLTINGTVTASAFVNSSGGSPPPPPCESGSTATVELGFEDTPIADAGSNCLTTTISGNVHADTSWAAAGSSSASFDGIGDAVVVGPNSVLAFGSGDWQIDLDVKSTQTTRADLLNVDGSYTAANWYGLLMNVGVPGKIQWYEGSTPKITALATGWNDGAAHHITVARVGNTVTLSMDGTALGSYTTSYSFGDSLHGVRIGNSSNGNGYSGLLDQVVID